MPTKILFILRRRQDFDPTQHTAIGMQTGLYNSASYMHNMLIAAGVNSVIELAIDNNCIDRLVTKHRPTHVIIEALWVVPTKFVVLTKLHPSVTWIVRLHSETPFLAQEGIAFDWLGDYTSFPNIIIAANAPRMLSDVRCYLSTVAGWDEQEANRRIIYLPNYYPQQYKEPRLPTQSDIVNVGCLGAVRPLKNHMVQALASLKFAKASNKKLYFHINARIEQKSDTIVQNLKLMFQHLAEQGHQLIIHHWVPRAEFLQVCSEMDIGIQVSFSETFNIVGADLVSQGVPFIGSTEIPWMAKENYTNVSDSTAICNALIKAYHQPAKNVSSNQQALTKYTNTTQSIWVSYFKE